MNFKDKESQQKLKGSYYTPKWLADYIVRWVTSYSIETVLEPSCGEGVFLDSLKDLDVKKIAITALDSDEEAILKCKEKNNNVQFEAIIKCEEFIEWAIDNYNSKKKTFDAAIGNPPFIRYQYLESEVQERAQEFFRLLGIKFTKHTNIWIPFVLACIKFLNPGGRLGMVIPSEILHVLYAKELRKYILDNCERVLLIDPEDIWFEETLQGAMIIMLEKKVDISKGGQGLAIVRTRGTDFAQLNPVDLFNGAEYINGEFLQNKWTYALLSQRERDAFQSIKCHTAIKRFSELADADVGIVTGANEFFLVTDEIVGTYNLHGVAKPMFGRSNHCPGIIYDEEQHQKNVVQKYPTNFLWFENDNAEQEYAEYIALGEKLGLPNRYKCRIRKPWYKVPSVYATPVCMLKRSNGIPRLILNQIDAYTTDTAYRVKLKDGVDAEVLVSCFINTITALSAELEGRYYGGGVLELVPSEIERLLVPYTGDKVVDIKELDCLIKVHGVKSVLERQDKIIFEALQVNMEDIRVLNLALIRLIERRQRKEESTE